VAAKEGQEVEEAWDHRERGQENDEREPVEEVVLEMARAEQRVREKTMHGSREQ